MIRIYVGTDQYQKVAEEALVASIRTNTKEFVSICWMRAGDEGFPNGWEQGWATPFSCYRLWVPRLCKHEGRAIYLDADMIVLGDLNELWEIEIPKKFACAAHRNRPDVIVWECSRVPKNLAEDYSSFIWIRNHCHQLADCWNHQDTLQKDTKLLHLTGLCTQPWKPYPHRYSYKAHPDPAAEALFWHYSLHGSPT